MIMRETLKTREIDRGYTFYYFKAFNPLQFLILIF